MPLEQPHHLGLVYVAYLLAVASPGPSIMAIIGVAMNRGRLPAVALALGIMTGSQVWAFLAAAGIASILTTYAAAITVLKLAGGAYLLFLAWKSGRSALSKGSRTVETQARRGLGSLYLKGLMIHLTNPKAILGWIAIMALGLGPGATPATMIAILAGCATIGLCVFLGYAVIFSAPAMGQAYVRCRRGIEGGLACVFGLAGLRLLLSRP
jgi:threonine efflux protein